MKTTLVSMAIALTVATSGAAHAADDVQASAVQASGESNSNASSNMSHGEVKKVDAATGKLTIKHGPLENLGMDAMTMVFKVADPAMLLQVHVGDRIDFVAEQINNQLTVTRLQKQ